MTTLLAMLDDGGRAWHLWLDRVLLAVCLLSQAGLLAAFWVNLNRGSLDRASVGLFFFFGFFCIDYGLWIRGVRFKALVRGLTLLLEAGRKIEDSVSGSGGLGSGLGQRRLRQLNGVMKPITTLVKWQSPTVSVVLLIMFVIKGHHLLPNWPEGRGIADPWEHFIVLVHVTLIAYGGRSFLLVCGLHWISSLCMDCALHILAQQAERAASWKDLESTVRLHQRLEDGFRHVQAFFADDLSIIMRIMLFFGMIGALRVAFGVLDVNNVVVLCIVFSYVATVCLAGELQEVAGDEFHHAVCQCPWDTWPTDQRSYLNLTLARTIRPTQVRFRYFGAMRLDTLSSIFNNVFKYVQVLRTGFGSHKWTAE